MKARSLGVTARPVSIYIATASETKARHLPSNAPLQRVFEWVGFFGRLEAGPFQQDRKPVPLRLPIHRQWVHGGLASRKTTARNLDAGDECRLRQLPLSMLICGVKEEGGRMEASSRPRQITQVIIAIMLLTPGMVWAQEPPPARSAESSSRRLAKASASLGSLRNELEQIRGRFPGDMSIYMKNISNGDEIAVDSDSVYETFSVIKLAIAAELMHQVEAGKLSLSDRIQTKAEDERLPSGVLYALAPGLNPTLKDLLTLMIIISDNEATDLLADKVGRGHATEYMHSLGLGKTSIEFSDLDWDRKWLSTLDPSYKNASGDRTVSFPFGRYSDAEVQRAFGHTIYDAGIYFGHSTTREIGRLLEMMALGKLVSKDASDLILSTMEKQQVNDRFPRYLKDVRLAHKTGDGQPFIANDAGIIWVKGQAVVLVVFTGHHRGDTVELHESIARVAALVVKHYGGALSADFR